MFDFSELLAISSFAGQRYDLVQAGGGNSSAKLEDGTLYVKRSGIKLADIQGEEGFCCLDWRPLLEFINGAKSGLDARELEKAGAEKVKSAVKSSGTNPSIETLMHCALGPLTLHTHPIAVTTVVCRDDWQEKLHKIFDAPVCIEYVTPGAALALAIANELKRHHWQVGMPVSIFLQNHGLIVAGTTAKQVIDLTDEVCGAISQYLQLDLSRYAWAAVVAQLVNEIAGTKLIAWLSEDKEICAAARQKHNLLLAPCAMPDQLVYCGPCGLLVEDQEESSIKEAVQAYFRKHGQPPKVVLIKAADQAHVILLGRSLKNCRDGEDVLKAHLLMLEMGEPERVSHLSLQEVQFLTNWDAEKYRQNV